MTPLNRFLDDVSAKLSLHHVVTEITCCTSLFSTGCLLRDQSINTHFVQLPQGKLNLTSIALAASPHRLLVWHHCAQRNNKPPTTRSDSLLTSKSKQAILSQSRRRCASSDREAGYHSHAAFTNTSCAGIAGCCSWHASVALFHQDARFVLRECFFCLLAGRCCCVCCHTARSLCADFSSLVAKFEMCSQTRPPHVSKGPLPLGAQ